MKKLIPALAMLVVSAVLMGTSTFAWFAMNTKVTAQGMNVQAKAEVGLVISNASDGTFASTADSTISSTTQLRPASTADGVVWFHTNSDALNSAAKGASIPYSYVKQGDGLYTIDGSINNGDTVDEGYYKTTDGTSFTDAEGDTAATATNEYCTKTANTNAEFYVVHNFYIKSSAATDISGQTLKVDGVTITGSSSSPALDKALRVLVVYDNGHPIFSASDDTSYNVGTGTKHATASVTPTAIAASGLDTNIKTGVTIPGSGSTPLNIKIYIFFEGEDENCKSSNITATLDTLAVTVTFTFAPDA